MIIGALCSLGPRTARARPRLLDQGADRLLGGGDVVERALQLEAGLIGDKRNDWIGHRAARSGGAS
jgi:hypothetical protein